MKTPPEFLSRVRVRNFKAIKDSKVVRLTPLTILIGNNGSGKSSLIEALQCYWETATAGLDAAMLRWKGIEHVLYKHVKRKPLPSGVLTEPWSIDLQGKGEARPLSFGMTVSAMPGFNGMRIEQETVHWKDKWTLIRNSEGIVTQYAYKDTSVGKPAARYPDAGMSALPQNVRSRVEQWQFLTLSPDRMSHPAPKRLAPAKHLLLNPDGSNIAQYLQGIRDRDPAAFEGIVQTMAYVLDYAQNLEPVETQEIQRTMYVQMLERGQTIPAWMLSSGTLRILGLLAVLRNPTPPPLIVIEELENGLDPRTVNLLVQEIRSAVESGRTQVIATTHSPYLLDLLDLSHIVLCERVNGNPVFSRPQDSVSMRDWAKSFAPGQLYTMDRMHVGGGR